MEQRFLYKPDPSVPGARQNSSFITSVMLSVLMRFDYFIFFICFYILYHRLLPFL